MEIISVRLKRLKELDYFSKLLNENRSEVVRDLVEEGKKLKAIELYKQKKVSLGLASKLSGLILSEFLDLLEEYNVRPGELRVKLEIADWLLYAAEEVGRIMHYQYLLKEIVKLRLRLKYGVKEELLPLVRLENIGRIRARILFRNRLRDIKDLKSADLSSLAHLIGEKTALSVKKQLGQEQSEVPENKRKGQISLRDWEE